MERAYRRQRFSQLLVALCEQLDRRHRAVVDCHVDCPPDPGAGGRAALDAAIGTARGRVDVTVRSVRAFGSWARGAAVCGNLDLAIEMDSRWVDGPWQGNRLRLDQPIDGVEIARALLGRRPGVRYIDLETVAAGPQAIDAAELRLVWQARAPALPLLDWRAAIAAIRLDPAARRFPSSIISLPAREAPRRAAPIRRNERSAERPVERGAERGVDRAADRAADRGRPTRIDAR